METQGHILGTYLARISIILVLSGVRFRHMTQFGGSFLSLNDVKFRATAPDPVSQCST